MPQGFSSDGHEVNDVGRLRMTGTVLFSSFLTRMRFYETRLFGLKATMKAAGERERERERSSKTERSEIVLWPRS